MDDEIIAAVSGNAFGGETGSTTIALPSGQKITESGTAGLTIAKLRTAKEILIVHLLIQVFQELLLLVQDKLLIC